MSCRRYWEHCAPQQNGVGVQVLPDVDVTLHDYNFVQDLVDAFYRLWLSQGAHRGSIVLIEGWLEQRR